MPRNTTVCQIKSFIPLKNMNVVKLRFTKTNTEKSNEVCVKTTHTSEFSYSPGYLLPLTLSNTNSFYFYNNFYDPLIINKDCFIGSQKDYDLIR